MRQVTGPTLCSDRLSVQARMSLRWHSGVIESTEEDKLKELENRNLHQVKDFKRFKTN